MVKSIYCLLILMSFSVFAHEKASNDSKKNCDKFQIECATTVTSAFDTNGNLWRLWSQSGKLLLQKSVNESQFGQTIIVNETAEKISARGENRPKIGFDKTDGIYIAWASPREKRFTADVRFSYSLNSGKTFSKPQTINDDGLLAGHSFNEMLVSPEGNVSMVWLDSRDRVTSKEKKIGSSIYFAEDQPNKSMTAFANKRLVSGTCQCCRLAFTTNKNDEPVVFWRHIFGDNIREFAIMTLGQDSTPLQISKDEWKIAGCPHQGGAVSVDTKNRYHMVWFNQGAKGKGVFYGYSDEKGHSMSKPVAIGRNEQGAAHPHLLSEGNRVDVVWLENSKQGKSLWHQMSLDRGKTFSKAEKLSEVDGEADRPFIVQGKNKTLVSWFSASSGHQLITL